MGIKRKYKLSDKKKKATTKTEHQKVLWKTQSNNIGGWRGKQAGSRAFLWYI